MGRAKARPYRPRGSGLWRRNGQERHDVRPFRFAVREIAENLWKCGPRAESALEGAGVIFPLAPVCATRRYGAVPANDGGPILQQFAVLEAHVQRMWVESGSPNGVIPSGEEFGYGMLGDSCEGQEFASRWRTTGAPGDGDQGVQDVLLVRLYSQGAFDVY